MHMHLEGPPYVLKEGRMLKTSVPNSVPVWQAQLAQEYYRHMTEQRTWLTLDELAVVFSTTRQTVYNTVRRHGLKPQKVGRNLMYLRETVAPYLAPCMLPANEQVTP
jgi:Helix-turn-helix domain